MQERRALQPDLHERRLHAGHDAADASLVNVADIAAPQRTFDVHFLQHAVFDHRHAGFARSDVDQNFFGHKSTWAIFLRRFIA